MYTSNLSGFAKQEILNLNLFYGFIGFAVFLVVFFVALFSSSFSTFQAFFPDQEYAVWVFAAGLSAIVVIIARSTYASSRRKVFEENHRDLARGKCIEDLYTELDGDIATIVPNNIVQFGDTWWPEDVMYFAGGLQEPLYNSVPSISYLQAGGKIISKQDVPACVAVNPDILNLSTVVLLRNSTGRTLYVLLPNPRMAWVYLYKVLEQVCGTVTTDTHVHSALNMFLERRKFLFFPLVHPDLIGMLHVFCNEPLEKRPQVTVRGDKLSDGLILASALICNGRTHMFFPHGFFEKLAQAIGSILNVSVQLPKLEEVSA